MDMSKCMPPAVDLERWQGGLWAAVAAIEAARGTGDKAPLELLGTALGIGEDPADRGAWEAVCEALLEPRG
jgi:hypothetical protein